MPAFRLFKRHRAESMLHAVIRSVRRSMDRCGRRGGADANAKWSHAEQERLERSFGKSRKAETEGRERRDRMA